MYMHFLINKLAEQAENCALDSDLSDDSESPKSTLRNPFDSTYTITESSAR